MPGWASIQLSARIWCVGQKCPAQVPYFYRYSSRVRCIYDNSIYLKNEIVFTTFRLLVYDTQRYHPFVPMLTLGPRLLIHSWLYHSHESFLFFRDTTLTCNTWFFFFCLMTERLSKSTCLKSLAWSLRRRTRGRGIFP